MKATHTKTSPTFTPVTINITCETQEELDAMYMLTNHAFVLDAVGDVTSRETYRALDCVRDEVRHAGARTEMFEGFAARVKSIFRCRS